MAFLYASMCISDESLSFEVMLFLGLMVGYVLFISFFPCSFWGWGWFLGGWRRGVVVFVEFIEVVSELEDLGEGFLVLDVVVLDEVVRREDWFDGMIYGGLVLGWGWCGFGIGWFDGLGWVKEKDVWFDGVFS